MGVIFHTIEQLTVKLHRLKVRGAALGQEAVHPVPGTVPREGN
jgi:hypothetical protein